MRQGNRNGCYEVFWPRGGRQQKARALAPRLDSLEGKTIAQLWTFGFRGDQVFEALEEGLKARYPQIRFLNWKHFGNIHSPNERELVAGLPKTLDELGVDAVISGMAC